MAINLYNMGTIERTRVIRPSSRKDKSTYKVDIERRQEKDSLHLTVTHENDCNFRKEYYFSANQLSGKSPSTSNGTEMILFGPMELYRFELLNKKQYRKFHFHGIMKLAFRYICIINAFFIVHICQ